jgi:hypothetical protein
MLGRMTYLELVAEWENNLRSRGELVDVKIYRGDTWNQATPEQRAEALVDLLTARGELVDLENF